LLHHLGEDPLVVSDHDEVSDDPGLLAVVALCVVVEHLGTVGVEAL